MDGVWLAEDATGPQTEQLLAGTGGIEKKLVAGCWDLAAVRVKKVKGLWGSGPGKCSSFSSSQRYAVGSCYLYGPWAETKSSGQA